MAKDLGTYHVRVVLQSGDGFISRWTTGGRFVGGGTSEQSPLSARWASPIYESEEDLIDSILYMFADGNYSCDCNKKLFLWRANNPTADEPETECGDTLKIAAMSVIRPDGSEIELTQRLAAY